eukprot:COSAG03_NODE_2587_length_2616_cov_1.955105_2_plen_68_part_01
MTAIDCAPVDSLQAGGGRTGCLLEVLPAPPRRSCDAAALATANMVSTIKVGMGGAKSTYLRNQAFRSP